MSSQGFQHIGKIISIEESEVEQRGVVYVSISPIAACEGCKAKSQCHSMSEVAKDGTKGDSQNRVVKVECDNSRVSMLAVGDMVDVSVTYRIGMIAVMVAYIIPLFVFIVMLAGLVAGVGLDQGLAALVTFATLGIYYCVVYALRGYFEQVVAFEIDKR